MVIYASPTPVLHLDFSQVDMSQEPFIRHELVIDLRYDPNERTVSVDSNITGTQFTTRAHSALCLWNEKGFWEWDMELVDSHLFMWVLARKDKFDLDISTIINAWTGKAK